MLTGSSPIFVAADVAETIRFYREVLGFPSSWAYGDSPDFGAATWGKVTIMFSLQPEFVGKVEGHGHWLDVEDVNGLYAQHLERGAMIVSPIEDKPWGKREYTVRDINGYHLRFAGDPSYTPKGTGVFPDGVKIVRRMPTTEEHERVAGSEFYKDGVPTGVLERTWKGVVATDASGEVIGTVRIMYDAPGWFSIWDVAVLPDWQGKRIGTAMMEAALEIVRDESPGAFVYLFTFKHGFYERLGFGKETLTMRKV
jgi:ribosomal protein S18 acetylase RimI-like enzyme